MLTANHRKSDATSQHAFQDSLRLVAGISSWQLWSSVLVILLLTGTIVLLSFPALLNAARGLIVLTCAVSGATVGRQLNRLKVLRQGLIEHMDSATKHRVQAHKFYGLSTIDVLTGLYNRRFGDTRLREEIERAEKSGEPLILLAIDFDRFKEINDKYGHAAGDLALKEFSRRLQRAIRACDVPVRLGGDEFLVILPECPADKIEVILSRMHSIAFDLNGKKIPVCFSYGMAQFEVSDTPETMIRRADERLYSAKEKRKAAYARPTDKCQLPTLLAN